MTKEKILEYFKDINLVYNSCTMHDSLASMLDELTQENDSSNEWIPCDQREPEHDGWYLITEWHRGHQHLEVNINQWKDGSWWLVDIADKPVAWMPLPEPYTKEDESNAI